MREIQELTMRRLTEVHAIDEEIASRRAYFREAYAKFQPQNACGLHYVAVPTTSIDLGRVVKRPELYAKETEVSVFLNGELLEEARWRFGEFHNWRPALRAVDAIEKSERKETRFSLTSGGLCEFVFFVGKVGDEFAPFFAPWFASSMGLMLNWIDRVRREGGFADQEYAVAPTFIGRGRVGLKPYGNRAFSDAHPIPESPHLFPIYPVGSRSDFDAIIARFNEDFWNAVHVDPHREITFQLSAA